MYPVVSLPTILIAINPTRGTAPAPPGCSLSRVGTVCFTKVPGVAEDSGSVRRASGSEPVTCAAG